jgi:hypothetical protein
MRYESTVDVQKVLFVWFFSRRMRDCVSSFFCLKGMWRVYCGMCPSTLSLGIEFICW